MKNTADTLNIVESPSKAVIVSGRNAEKTNGFILTISPNGGVEVRIEREDEETVYIDLNVSQENAHEVIAALQFAASQF